ncbi:hypothetical protein niasHT_006166 [Heterodera trifolii]|uniref:Uncharacterized protein n=1 Tax=Heterodera trifolii TaxID=157864 RepID=A0ABD2M4H9_9BILA
MVSAKKAVLSKQFLDTLNKRKMELLTKQKTPIHPLGNDNSTDQNYQLAAKQMPSPMDVVEMLSPKNGHKICDKNGTTDQSQSEYEGPAKDEANNYLAKEQINNLPLNACPLANNVIGIDGVISAKTAETLDTINQLSSVQFRAVKFFAKDRKLRVELLNKYTLFRELLESRISILSDTDKFTVQIEHQWERNWSQFKCVSNLSQNAKSLLQFECERYACCLMHFSRFKHGNERGMMRYAEIIYLAEQLFYAQSKLHSHLTFIAMITHQDTFYETTPSPFVPMLLNGYE